MEWRDYDSLEPFGEERADLRSGTIASVVANVHAGKGGRRFKPADFMPQFSMPRSTTMERRKPLTDQVEWKGVLRMAKIVATAKDG